MRPIPRHSPSVGSAELLRRGDIGPGNTLDLRPNSTVGLLLDRIIDGKIVQLEEWQSLPADSQFHIRHSASSDELGDAIPLSARITAVASILSAKVASPPYLTVIARRTLPSAIGERYHLFRRLTNSPRDDE
jgi:hypothetical protein